MQDPTAAHYAIIVDDKPLSYRDDKEIAIEAAKYLKERRPQEQVSVRDLRDDKVIEIGWESGRAFVHS
jgi:hypothetical protein